MSLVSTFSIVRIFYLIKSPHFSSRWSKLISNLCCKLDVKSSNRVKISLRYFDFCLDAHSCSNARSSATSTCFSHSSAWFYFRLFTNHSSSSLSLNYWFASYLSLASHFSCMTRFKRSCLSGICIWSIQSSISKERISRFFMTLWIESVGQYSLSYYQRKREHFLSFSTITFPVFTISESFLSTSEQISINESLSPIFVISLT